MAPQANRLTFILVDIFCVAKGFAASLLGMRCESYDERPGWPKVQGVYCDVVVWFDQSFHLLTLIFCDHFLRL